MFTKILLPLAFFLSQLSTGAALKNITIDDATGDPVTGRQIVYDPSIGWNTESLCRAGPGKCTATPSRDLVNDGTWHESTFNPSGTVTNSVPNTPLSATIQFDGTAVYVYCVLAKTASGPTGTSVMSFYIDGNLIQGFNLSPPPGSSGYEYNVPVFSHTGLSSGTHEIKIVNGMVGGVKSLIILDRIVYTSNSDDSGVSTNAPVTHDSTTTTTIKVETGPATAPTPAMPIAPPDAFPSTIGTLPADQSSGDPTSPSEANPSQTQTQTQPQPQPQSQSAAISGSAAGGGIQMILSGMTLAFVLWFL